MCEVEDIMFDQCIIASEFNVEFRRHKKSFLIIPATKLWLAVDLVTRAVLPSLLKFCYICIQNQQSVVSSVRHQVIPTLMAFIANSLSKSLASVQRITYPITIKIIKDSNQATITSEDDNVDETPEKCVECVVLAKPIGELQADVIFIHGLHGGLNKTWRQGTWRHDGHKLNNQSPIIRRQSTGDLHVPPRQHSLKRAFSGIYSKIPNKIARKENETCVVREEEEYDMFEEEIEEGYSNCWPQDWLPKDCPNVRVIAINYSTDMLWSPLWQKKRVRTDMVERSKEMTDELLRLGVGHKPIIWVGHSKGGLYIKQIIINAFEESVENPEVGHVYNETKAILFYSVPHKGSVLADFTFPFLRRSVELLEIQRNGDFVLDLHKRFLNIFEDENNNMKPHIFSFIETSYTLMGFMYMRIIAYESGDPDIGIKCDVPLDHREICKPAGRDCFLYLELVKIINNCLEKH